MVKGGRVSDSGTFLVSDLLLSPPIHHSGVTERCQLGLADAAALQAVQRAEGLLEGQWWGTEEIMARFSESSAIICPTQPTLPTDSVLFRLDRFRPFSYFSLSVLAEVLVDDKGSDEQALIAASQRVIAATHLSASRKEPYRPPGTWHFPISHIREVPSQVLSRVRSAG